MTSLKQQHIGGETVKEPSLNKNNHNDTEFGNELTDEQEAIQKVREALFEMHNQAGIYDPEEE